MPKSEVKACKAAHLFSDPSWPDLIEEYVLECGNALVGKPAPSLELYEGMESAASARCFGAYHGDKLCGFACVLTAVVPHYSLACATVESLFVTRHARHTGLGATLMERIDAHARMVGCEAIFYAAPVASRLDLLLTSRPAVYRRTNHVYTKRLK